jgi:hypothetical protein
MIKIESTWNLLWECGGAGTLADRKTVVAVGVSH